MAVSLVQNRNLHSNPDPARKKNTDPKDSVGKIERPNFKALKLQVRKIQSGAFLKCWASWPVWPESQVKVQLREGQLSGCAAVVGSWVEAAAAA